MNREEGDQREGDKRRPERQEMGTGQGKRRGEKGREQRREGRGERQGHVGNWRKGK